jgi:type II secretory pathway pseudopilin PulG
MILQVVAKSPDALRARVRLRRRPRSGFSMIEMIGVLVVVALLVVALALVALRSLDLAFSRQEGATLQTFAVALQNSILRNRYIPGPGDWSSVIATEAGVGTNAVLLTPRNTPRLFLVDPNLQLGPPGTTAPYLPYSQGTAGSVQPVSGRLLLLSSLSVPLPAAATNGGNFNALWNTVDGYLPTNGCFNGWNGRSDDLKVQRITLAPLFQNLQLANYLSTDQGQYLMDGQGPATVSSNGLNSFFIQGSVLTLITGSSSGGNTNAELMINRSLSLFYVQQIWRDVPYVPDYSASQTNFSAANLATAIAIASTMFVNSPYNINSSVTPPQVLSLMSNFMSAYIPYANWVVNSNNNTWVAPATTDPNYPIYAAAKSSQTALAAALGNLANPSGGSGNMIQGGCTNPPVSP